MKINLFLFLFIFYFLHTRVCSVLTVNISKQGKWWKALTVASCLRSDAVKGHFNTVVKESYVKSAVALCWRQTNISWFIFDPMVAICRDIFLSTENKYRNG